MSFVVPAKKGPTSKVPPAEEGNQPESLRNDKGKEKQEQPEEPVGAPPTLALKYERPSWSSLPQEDWYVQVVKNGTIIDSISISTGKEFLVCGRVPTCDLPMEHESVSRLHAVLQFSGGILLMLNYMIDYLDGKIFIFDLESSHGTFLNKQRIPIREFVAIPSGSTLRFGESSRLYLIEKGEETTRVLDATDTKQHTDEVRLQIPDPLGLLREWFIENGLKLHLKEVSSKLRSDPYTMLVTIPTDICGNEEELKFEGVGSTRLEAELEACLSACKYLIKEGEMTMEDNSSDWQRWKQQKQQEAEEEEDIYYDRTHKKSRIDEGLTLTERDLERLADDIKRQLKDIELKLEDSASESAVASVVEADELDMFMRQIDTIRILEHKDGLMIQQSELKKELDRIQRIMGNRDSA